MKGVDDLSVHEFYEDSPTKRKTRDNIIRTASRLYAEKGIVGVTMKDIAEAAGLTPRNLSRYYPGKDYLVVDVAYAMMTVFKERQLYETKQYETGIEQMKEFLDRLLEMEMDSSDGNSMLVFIMYFDLYLSKMAQDHPAYMRYVEHYVPEINELGYEILGGILKSGIEDGTIKAQLSEVDVLCDYILQSFASVATRAVIKESENKRINRTLVTRHIDVILNYLTA